MTFTLHWPQIVYIVMVVLGLGMTATNHGNKKMGKDNFFISLISSTIMISILYAGGFFG